MASIHPYLHFNGNAEEAFNFYKSIFGGELSNLQRYKDSPEPPAPNVDPEKILHAVLPIGKYSVLMGGDRHPTTGEGTFGNNFNLSYQPDTLEDTKRIFSALSDGGTVRMPLEKAFWGAYFGMVTDKFGVQWMINFELK